jgi:hypothetical protein
MASYAMGYDMRVKGFYSNSRQTYQQPHKLCQWLSMVLMILVVGVAVSSCSSGPSDSEIDSAVRAALKQKVPATAAHYLTGGEKAQVNEIKVISRGKRQSHGDSKYWPVKVHVKGTCAVLFGSRQTFDGEVEYYMYQDPYGEWRAECQSL